MDFGEEAAIGPGVLAEPFAPPVSGSFVKILLASGLGILILSGLDFYIRFSMALPELRELDQPGLFSIRAHLLTFYGFLALILLGVLGTVVLRRPLEVLALLAASGVFLSAALYTVPGVFSLNFCMASALAIIAGISLGRPWNIAGLLSFLLPFAFLGGKPQVVSVSIVSPGRETLGLFDRLLLVGIPGGLGALVIYARNIAEYRYYEEKMNLHHREILFRLSEFNRRLQAHVEEAGEESAARERNRITREMHDSNGYAFTNIIALMDAAISSRGQSWDKVEEQLQLARDQAYDGLMESRRTLRRLRNNINPPLRNLPQYIFEIARIFRECTGSLLT